MGGGARRVAGGAEAFGRPRGGCLMAEVRVVEETDTPSGWRLVVRVGGVSGPARSVEVLLSWADHDHWSHGGVGPAVVAEALVRFLLRRTPLEEVRSRFDASFVRRLYPTVDVEMRRRFGLEADPSEG